jgi:membrane protein
VPTSRPSGWRWASFGAVLAGALWTVATVVFAVYVNHFSSFDRTYGALAGVIVLMLWFYLSAFVILFCALVNAESERVLHGGTLPRPERADDTVERSREDRAAESDQLQEPALPCRGR